METLLNILSTILWIGLALSILVFIHELGHFLAARLFGMRVDKFSIGFPPKIVARKFGDTVYQIGATPLGGYVKIAGMIDESLDADYASSEPQPWEFRSKPVWQRIVVICAGVTFNLILAVAIFIGLKYVRGADFIPADRIEQVYVEQGSVAFDMGLRTGDRIVAVNGEPITYYEDIQSIRAIVSDRMSITVERDEQEQTFTAPEDLLTQLNRAEGSFGISAFPSLIGAVLEDWPADEAGIEAGDRVVAVNETPVQFWQQMTELIQEAGGEPLAVQVKRQDGEVIDRTITPRQNGEQYMIGIQIATPEMLYEEWGVVHEDYSLPEAFVEGVKDTYTTTVATVLGFKRIFAGPESLTENIGGPIAIASETKKAADRGMADFWFIVALLSITLAFLNILPIPALDGGHLVFLIYEGITRREPSLRFRLVVQQIGMVLILGFMAFVIFNDILKL